MAIERRRHIAKAITWRVIATLTTILLAWLFTNDIDIALKFGVVEVIIKLTAYYFHERVWYKWIKYGVKKG